MAISLDDQRRLCELITRGNPGDHFHALQITFTQIDKGQVIAELPYHPDNVGNPVNGVTFGGAITALLDTSCGFAAATALDEVALCPTMDLRIDYMRSAQPGLPVYAESETYRVSSNVVFTRGIAYQTDKKDPIAHCVANFTRMDPQVNQQMLAHLKPKLAQIDLQQIAEQRRQSKSQRLSEPSDKLHTALLQAREQRRPELLITEIPYAHKFGIEAIYRDAELLFKLPVSQSLVGNPTLPAIHGGAVAGFMEMAAALHLLMTKECLRAPKVVDFSIDYVRAGRLEDCFTCCEVVRQGRKLVNVSLQTWQRDRQQPIATARVHFLLD